MVELIVKAWEHCQWGIAGFFGSLVAVPFQRDARTKRSLLAFVVSGSLCAHYLTGMVGEYFHITPASLGGIGFLLGAFGGAIIAGIMRALETADLWSIIRARFGGGSQ